MKFASLIVLGAALTLAGCAANETHTDDAAQETAEAPAVQDRYEIMVGTNGFEPSVVHAEAGKPVTLVFTRTTEETCGTEVIFASQNMEKELPLNEPVEVTLTPDHSGEIAFNCGMDMMKGKVVVN